MQKDKNLTATINAMNVSKSKGEIVLLDNSMDKIAKPKHPKSYVRCKS